MTPPKRRTPAPRTAERAGPLWNPLCTVDHGGRDIETTAEGRGADAASRPARPDPDQLDDSFHGEVSSGEASGEDSQ